MTLIGALARAVLLAYPNDFRSQFGDQILADIDDDSAHGTSQLLDLLKGAVLMHLDSLMRDVSYAVRRLRSAPLFLAIVTLTFALGIGANVAIFSVLDAVVLKPLPFPHASSLGIISIREPDGSTIPSTSISDSVDLGSRSKDIEQIAAARSDESTMVLAGKPYALFGLDVTPNYFSMLGIAARYGRILAVPDAQPNVYTIVISDDLWRRRFNADPRAIGKIVILEGERARIVGVLYQGQQFVNPNGNQITSHVDFLEATRQRTDPNERPSRTAGSIARLSGGATFEQANVELALISARLQKLYTKQDVRVTFLVRPLTESALGSAASALWIIFAAGTGILLIACLNVGNLLAARWSSRDREIAVRRALGASLQSIARQLLVETGLLATIGALLGVAGAFLTERIVVPLAEDTIPRIASTGIDVHALLYAFAVIVLATLLAGLSPVLSLGSENAQAALKSAGRGGDGSQSHRVRTTLVVVEVALALSLVVTAGLMVRNFIALINTPLDIHPNGLVVTDDVMLRTAPGSLLTSISHSSRIKDVGYPKERELLQRLRVLPGVESVALALNSPLGGVGLRGPTPVIGRNYPRGDKPIAWANAMTPDYLRTMGIPLLRGRNFDSSDVATSAPVVLVNEAFSRKYLAGTRIVGVRITVPPLDSPATIVGVIGDTRRDLIDPVSPEFYLPAEQEPFPLAGAVVYAPRVAATTLEREIRDTFAQTMPLTEPPATYTMADRIADATAQARFATTLLGALAAIALLLALAGIFGVVSFSVTQRSREFGIRMALGATPNTIVSDVLSRAMVTASIGVAFGLGIAACSARAIASQLTDLSPFDPLTFAAVVALIFLFSALASLQPALRATHVAPAEALRHE